MALDFQAIGLKPKLVELEFPRVRARYRTKAIHGRLFPSRHSSRAGPHETSIRRRFVGLLVRASGDRRAPGSTANCGGYRRTSRLLREIGDHKFDAFAEIPMFWLFAEAVVNPKYIAEYAFPGVDHRVLHASGVH